MPRNTHILNLEEEADALDQEAADVHDRYQAAEDGSDAAQRLQQQGLQLDERLAALEWAVDEYGPDAEIVVWELTPGEKARYTDKLQNARSQASSQGELGGVGMAGVHWVAAAVREAPFYGDDIDTHDDRVAAVAGADGPVPQLVEWLKSKATEVNSLGNPKRTGFAGRARESQQTSGPD